MTNPCDSTLRQKWNAPPNLSSATLGGYWELTLSAEVTAYVIAGILGAIFGSFLNVVIWRVPRGEVAREAG